MGDNIPPIQDENESFTKIEEASDTSISTLNQQENKESNFSYIIDVSVIEEKKEEDLSWINNHCEEGKKAALDIIELKKYPPAALLTSRNNKGLLKITSCKYDEMANYAVYFIICNLDKSVEDLIKAVWNERKNCKCKYALDTVWDSWQMVVPYMCGLVVMIAGFKFWGLSFIFAYYLGLAVFYLEFFIMAFIYCQYKRRHRVYRGYYK